MIRFLAILAVLLLLVAILSPGCARPFAGLTVPTEDELLPWAWKYPPRRVAAIDANEYE